MRILALLALATTVSAAQTPTDSVKLSSVVSGLKLRSIGPALTSGRIADIAVHPTDKSIWYVATAAGGVWKTTNNGISLQPDLRRRGIVLDRRRDDRPPRTRTSSGSAPARTTRSASSRTATASTSRSTAARAGRTSGSRNPSTSAASSSIRATPTSSTSPRRVRSGARAATAASTRRPTAARRGRRL